MFDAAGPNVNVPNPDDVIRNWFVYHPATPTTGPMHDDVRSVFQNAADALFGILPPGPDRTVAFRKLQDAMMAANACVANNQAET